MDVFDTGATADGLEPDRFREAPHPREVLFCVGHGDAEQRLLDAYCANRLHHALMLSGPEGIGKATLAYRFARFLLAFPDPATLPQTRDRPLAVPSEHPVIGKIAREAHPDLAVIRRGPTKDGKSLRAEIGVDDVRAALGIFRTTAGAGGWRIIIVDAADDLNTASANALLKMLEEPPPRAIFLLVAHQPRAILPTIRSRCAKLPLGKLDENDVRNAVQRLTSEDPADIALSARNADGSIRRALAALDPDARAMRQMAEAALANLTGNEGRRQARTLIEKAQGKAGTEVFSVILETIEAKLAADLQRGVDRTEHPDVLVARAELWEKLSRSARQVETYNLDRRPFLLAMFSELAALERQSLGGQGR